MTNPRHWMIRKLGGIVLSDLSPSEQIMILQRKANEQRDRALQNVLKTTWPMYTLDDEEPS
jgi:hypothetical protein